MISFTTPKHHWNYLLAILQNLENTSRYVEFSNANLNTFSIEYVHILLSASSEVDVIMKQFCKLLDISASPENINEYRTIVKEKCPDFINEEVIIERYGMKFKPWLNWNGEENPIWWRSYNKVKHQRDLHFEKANLQNTLNAVGGLLITVFYYYKYQFSKESQQEISFKETSRQLEPKASFMRINNDNYYYSNLIV